MILSSNLTSYISLKTDVISSDKFMIEHTKFSTIDDFLLSNPEKTSNAEDFLLSNLEKTSNAGEVDFQNIARAIDGITELQKAVDKLSK